MPLTSKNRLAWAGIATHMELVSSESCRMAISISWTSANQADSLSIGLVTPTMLGPNPNSATARYSEAA